MLVPLKGRLRRAPKSQNQTPTPADKRTIKEMASPLRFSPGQLLSDPVTINDCSVSVSEQQDVPSQVDGVVEKLLVDLRPRPSSRGSHS